MWPSPALACLLGAALTVTVYEGQVALANDEGEITIEAGSTGMVSPGSAPRTRPSSDSPHETPEQRATQAEANADSLGGRQLVDLDSASIEELRAENLALRQARAAQAQQLAQLREQNQDVDLMADHQWYPPSQSDLMAMADRCILRVDSPPVLGMTPPERLDQDEIDLQPGEEEALLDAARRLHEHLREDLAQLYTEATGDAEGAVSLSARAMLDEIQDKSSDRRGTIMARIAQERAGMAQAPPVEAQGPAERAVRLFAGIGDEMQTYVAQALGPERAEELRSQDGGWPWSRSQFHGCPDED